MISARDIKHKIRTVQNLEQICRAMKTVASIRLRRAEQRLARTRPYRRRLADVVRRVAGVTSEHPFLQERAEQRVGVVVVTSDRGLCGGYNANAVRRALQVGGAERAAVFPVGRKGLNLMTRRGYEALDRLVPLGGEPGVEPVYRLARSIGRLYTTGTVDRVVAVYSRYLGGTRSEVRVDTLLPVTVEEQERQEIIFEPSPPVLLRGLMHRYLRTELLAAVLEGSASEHGARVAAMTAASDNAEEMITRLNLDYNKARQAGITAELTEIVTAGEATA